MGVMSCSNVECNNIMCDTHVGGVGYVCYECQENFKKFINQRGISIQSDHDIYVALKIFMDRDESYPDYDRNNAIISKFFEENTG